MSIKNPCSTWIVQHHQPTESRDQPADSADAGDCLPVPASTRNHPRDEPLTGVALEHEPLLIKRRLFDDPDRGDQQIDSLLHHLAHLEPTADEAQRRLLIDTLDDLAEQMIGRTGSRGRELKDRINHERAELSARAAADG